MPRTEPLACKFAVEATMPDDARAVHADYGAPDVVWLRVSVSPTSAASSAPMPSASVATPSSRVAAASPFAVSFDLQLFSKTPTRLAEASWFSFVPALLDEVPPGSAHPAMQKAAGVWRLSPFGDSSSEIDATDVVEHGATHLHSLGPDGSVAYTGRKGSFKLSPLDTPILSVGLLSPFPTPGDNTTLASLTSRGVHANLQNNIWNTNYPQWYPFMPEDADLRFRFELLVSEV